MTKKAKITIKQLLTADQNWFRFYKKHAPHLRKAIVTSIVKLLSCRSQVRGYHEYQCANPACAHIKRIPHTCKSRACSSCGKKATDRWIQQQNVSLPATTWQHITFTMPSELWDFFWYNRSLLNQIGKIAAACIKNIANKKGVIPGIFIAIHTFGRNLKRNVHLHLSTTLGGITPDLSQWKTLFFHQTSLMKMWRYQIIRLFRKIAKSLIIPHTIRQQLNPAFTLNHFFDKLYKKIWIVHCSKPSHNHQQNVSYLGRYIKRPPIAESKLKHYDGNEVTFKYLDHTTKTFRRFKLTAQQFIARFVQHIPDSGFKMIRYYGLLAHRVKTKLLPHVYQLLRQHNKNHEPLPLTYAQLIEKNFGYNPLICILCGQPLLLKLVKFGKTSVSNLLNFHRELALMKNF